MKPNASSLYGSLFVGYLPIIHCNFFIKLSVLGSYLLYGGIRGLFDENPPKRSIAFFPGGHTVNEVGKINLTLIVEYTVPNSKYKLEHAFFFTYIKGFGFLFN